VSIFFSDFSGAMNPKEYCNKLHKGGANGNDASISVVQEDDINLDLKL